MPKIKLGARPKTFERTVKFPMLDGTEGAIRMTFKYRTRKEFGVFIDEITADAKAAMDAEQKARSNAGVDDESPADVDLSTFMRDLMEKTAGANADYILKTAEGWNLDEPFDKVHVQQLADEIPAAAAAIMDDYRSACTEGRRGN